MVYRSIIEIWKKKKGVLYKYGLYCIIYVIQQKTQG